MMTLDRSLTNLTSRAHGPLSGRGIAVTLAVLVMGLAGSSRPLAGQGMVIYVDHLAAWMNEGERVIDAMDLRRRHGEWIEFLVDNRLEQEPALAPERDRLVAALRDSAPWYLVRAQHLLLLALMALDEPTDIEIERIPRIVDQMVQIHTTEHGIATLDMTFPPRDTLIPDDVYEQLLARLGPDVEFTTIDPMSDRFVAGEIMMSFNRFTKVIVWDPLLRVARRVFAAGEGGPSPSPDRGGQTSAERSRAWRAGTERIAEAMSLRSRHTEWIEYVVDEHLARDSTLVPQREQLIAAMHDGLPWDSVRVRHLSRLASVAAAHTPAVDVAGIPSLVDQVVRFYESPPGVGMLTLMFPTRSGLGTGRGFPALDALLDPASAPALDANSSVGRAVTDAFGIATDVWDDIRRVGRQIVSQRQSARRQ